MYKIAIASILAAICSGCVWTRQISEVTVHKDASGKITGIDYIERLEQQDAKPWSRHFGKYLFNQ